MVHKEGSTVGKCESLIADLNNDELRFGCISFHPIDARCSCCVLLDNSLKGMGKKNKFSCVVPIGTVTGPPFTGELADGEDVPNVPDVSVVLGR